MTDQTVFLVTGCSSGIGLATAEALREPGRMVIPTARKPEDLDMLRNQGFDPLELDVASSTSIQICAQTLLERTGGRIDGLVNNAGCGQPGAMEDLSRDQMQRQFDVNVFGLQEITNALLPPMLERKQGRIVHVSSVVGRIALPFMGIYSASKFALEAMADAQRVELSDTGVRISLIEPGPIRTAFRENAIRSINDAPPSEHSRFAALYARELQRRRDNPTEKNFSLPPEAVARKIVHALTDPHPHRRYRVTLPSFAGEFMRRFAPHALLDYILIREMKRR